MEDGQMEESPGIAEQRLQHPADDERPAQRFLAPPRRGREQVGPFAGQGPGEQDGEREVARKDEQAPSRSHSRWSTRRTPRVLRSLAVTGAPERSGSLRQPRVSP